MKGSWLHNCSDIDDNYGKQVVYKNEKCPFCNLTEDEWEDYDFIK